MPAAMPRETPETVEFTVDDIAGQLKIPPGDALARLLEWELTGEIRTDWIGQVHSFPE